MVGEEVREHRVLPGRQHADDVARDRAGERRVQRRRPDVLQRGGIDLRRQVEDESVERVAGPGVVEPRLTLRDVRVVVVVPLHVHGPDDLQHVVVRLLDHGGVRRVHVLEASAHHRHRERIAVAEQVRLVPRRVGPEHVVGVPESGDVDGEEVVPPEDARREHGVGDGVAGLLVVPGVAELVPHVGGEVREVVVVQRSQEARGDHLPHVVG